jgi:hypothetical protein
VFGVNSRERGDGASVSGKWKGIAAAAIGAWFSYVVLDFLTHGVVLAGWWRATEVFWLPPADLARRIPVAYGVFALYCASLTVLLDALRGKQAPVLTGLRFGTLVGFLFGLTSALGMYCLVRVPVSFMLVGPISTTVASGGAGAAAAWVSSGDRKWRRVGVLFAAGVALLVVGVIAQNVLHGS